MDRHDGRRTWTLAMLLLLSIGAGGAARAAEDATGEPSAPAKEEEEYAGIRCDHLFGYKADSFDGKISGQDTAGKPIDAKIKANVPSYFVFFGCDGRYLAYDIFLSAGQSPGSLTDTGSASQGGTTTLLENVMDVNATVMSRRWLKFELGLSLENYMNGAFRVQQGTTSSSREELLITSALGPDVKVKYYPLDEFGLEFWAAYNFLNLFSTHVRGIQVNPGGTGQNISTQEYNIGSPKFLSLEVDADFIPLDWLGFTLGVGNTSMSFQEIPKGSSTALSDYNTGDFYWLLGVNLLY